MLAAIIITIITGNSFVSRAKLQKHQLTLFSLPEVPIHGPVGAKLYHVCKMNYWRPVLN